MASQALRWYSSSSATVELFIAHGHADAVLAEACLLRLTMLMLLAVFGGWATMVTPCVVGVVAQWQYVIQLDWSECSVDEFVRTAVLIFAATGINLLLWPTPNVHQRAHRAAGFTEALARACAAHGAQHPSVQYGCLLQLGAHLSRRRGGSAEHVRQAGGMAAASAALTANPTHEGIRLEGLSLLANLSCLPPPAPRDDDDDDGGGGGGSGSGGGGGRGTGGGGVASAKKTDARTEDDDAPDADDAGAADAGAAAAIVGALAAGESCPEEAQAQGAIALANMTLVSHSVAQRGQSACLAAPQLGSCASSGRAWWLWAARRSQEEAGPLGAQPLPRVLELAATKAADFTAFDQCRWRRWQRCKRRSAARRLRTRSGCSRRWSTTRWRRRPRR